MIPLIMKDNYLKYFQNTSFLVKPEKKEEVVEG